MPGEPPTKPTSAATAQPTFPQPAAAFTPSVAVTSWSPGEDVIEVKRTPAPGAARSTLRTFLETARGLMTTLGRFREGPVTVQYPEEKAPVYPRFRGRHKLHRFEDTGL